MAAPITVRANFDFQAENDAELSFRIGDVILVRNRDDEGWWEGEFNGQRGLFPSNYVEAIRNGAPIRGSTVPPPPPGNNIRLPQQAGGGARGAGARGAGAPPVIAAPQKYFPGEQGAPPVIAAPQKYFPGEQGAQVAQFQFNNPGAPAPYQDRAQNYTALRDGGAPSGAQVSPVSQPKGFDSLAPNVEGVSRPAGRSFVKGTGGEVQQKPGGVVYQQSSPDVTPAQFRQTIKAAASKTKFGVFAASMAFWAGWTGIALGALGIYWGLISLLLYGTLDIIIGIYTIAISFISLTYEMTAGKRRGSMRFPLRGVLYIGFSVFTYFSLCTVAAGVMFTIVGIFNIVSASLGEVYDAPSDGPSASGLVQVPNQTLCEALFSWAIQIKEQNRLGTLVFIFLFFAGNVALFFVSLDFNINFFLTLPPDMAVTGWGPYAKAFGSLIDLNAAIILLPVCRTILRWMYNRSTADQTITARIFRGILYCIPIDKNIVFHKICAWMIMFGAVAHTITHFINYAGAPVNTIIIFRAWTFFSGGVIMICMLFIYGGAALPVRRGQFEIFWYSHHWFFPFFVFNLMHSRGYINLGYYPYFVGPGFFYLVERILRIYRANQKVVVLSITNMDDVLSIEFAKEGVFAQPYKEGQYIFLQSPPISSIQWHPFTISSAPEENAVTVHIRVLGDGSWTRGVRDYVSAMGPRNRAFFQLDRQAPNGKLQGKILGPDATPIFHIDGPHSAPTQHLGEYSTALVVGAGIGVTPVASALKSVIFHKWKYFIGQCFPDHAYFVWVCAHKDIDAFRWLIRTIKDAQDEVCHMRATNPAHMAAKSFEFHIYVSSTPKSQQPIELVVDDEIGFWGVPREDAKVEKVRANWDEADLYKTMMCPAPHTQLVDVHVWNGRPKWDERFSIISKAHQTDNIGVMYCGNPAIAKDLRQYCYVHSRGRKQGIFKLHKENF